MADIPSLSRLINGIQRNVDLATNTPTVQSLKINGTTSGHVQHKVVGAATSYDLNWPLTQSSGTKSLVNDGSGNLSWSSPTASVPSRAYEISNVGLSASVSSGALTIALKQANGTSDPSTGDQSCLIGFRSATATSGGYNQRSVTSALSLTLDDDTQLGNYQTSKILWVYAIDSDGAGAIKLGVSTVKYEDGSLQSTVPESATITVTIASPGVVTLTGHTFANRDKVNFSTSGTLPTGMSAQTEYYVVGVATNTFKFSYAYNGTGENTSGSQSGTHKVHCGDARLASDAFYSSKPIRLIGRIRVNRTWNGSKYVWGTVSEVTVTPQQLNSSERIAGRYYNTSKYSSYGLANNSTYSDYLWRSYFYDTHGLVWGDPGPLIIPKTGYYRFRLNMDFANVNQSSGYMAMGILVNGGLQAYSYDQPMNVANFNYRTHYLEFTHFCNKGDYIQTYLANFSGTTVTFNGSAQSYFEFEHIGNP